MTPSLRKAHRRIWLVMAILLPLVILTGAAVFPLSGPDIMPVMEEDATMDLNRIGESKGTIVWHGLSITGVEQLGIEMNSVFASASALVYLAGDDHQDLLIGKLNHAGLTLFEIPADPDLTMDTIRIEDAIKHHLLANIPLHIK